MGRSNKSKWNIIGNLVVSNSVHTNATLSYFILYNVSVTYIYHYYAEIYRYRRKSATEDATPLQNQPAKNILNIIPQKKSNKKEE
jgi:hypothetical protein